MKIVISPAKSLDFKTVSPIETITDFVFSKEATQLQSVLKKKKPEELATLMSISEKLSNLNWERNQDWKLPFETKTSKAALFAFTGDVYLGLEANTLSETELNKLQDQLFILSGLYGALKPFDAMMPYRLEMGTKLKIKAHDNLYQFWGNKVTDLVNASFSQDDVLVNLASNEYYKVIQPKEIKVPIITPQFKDYKDGKLKMISFFAKKARGMMVRYIVQNNVKTIEELKGFNSAGYALDESLSDAKNLVFTR